VRGGVDCVWSEAPQVEHVDWFGGVVGCCCGGDVVVGAWEHGGLKYGGIVGLEGV
jgi:hypothetical protein